MAIGGIYEYDKYQMRHPGKSASEQSSQGTELHVGKLKRHGRKKGTGKHNMIDLATEHIDMTGTCAVYNGQVNFRKVISKIIKKEKPICPEPATTLIERQIESRMPPVMNLLVSMVWKWYLGEPMPKLIEMINARQKLRANILKHQAILNLIKKAQIKKMAINDDVNSEEYKDAERRWMNRERCINNMSFNNVN